MRTCENCAYKLQGKKHSRQDMCIKIGNLCRVAVGYPDREGCTDHQYAEAELLPVLGQAVDLLDSIRITLSAPNSRKVEKIIFAYSHLGNRGDFLEISRDRNRVNLEVD